MKQVHILYKVLAAVAIVSLICSCGGKKKELTPEKMHQAYVSSLTSQDSTAVLELGTRCMDLLKNKQTDEALQMLYTLDEAGQPQPLTAEHKQKLASKFKLFPVLSYRLEETIFNSETENMIRYKIEFFERKESQENTPNTIGFMVAPVRVEGRWYLTLPETN